MVLDQQVDAGVLGLVGQLAVTRGDPGERRAVVGAGRAAVDADGLRPDRAGEVEPLLERLEVDAARVLVRVGDVAHVHRDAARPQPVRPERRAQLPQVGGVLAGEERRHQLDRPDAERGADARQIEQRHRPVAPDRAVEEPARDADLVHAIPRRDRATGVATPAEFRRPARRWWIPTPRLAAPERSVEGVVLRGRAIVARFERRSQAPPRMPPRPRGPRRNRVGQAARVRSLPATGEEETTRDGSRASDRYRYWPGSSHCETASSAPSASSTCSGRSAPTIGAVTSGWSDSQASAS